MKPLHLPGGKNPTIENARQRALIRVAMRRGVTTEQAKTALLQEALILADADFAREIARRAIELAGSLADEQIWDQAEHNGGGGEK